MTGPRSKSSSHSTALRDFLRGYLHEDWKEEYGSVEQAARQFCKDADSDQRRRLLTEWLAFTTSAKNQSMDSIAHQLRVLGSAWSPSSKGDLDAITRVLQRDQ